MSDGSQPSRSSASFASDSSASLEQRAEQLLARADQIDAAVEWTLSGELEGELTPSYGDGDAESTLPADYYKRSDSEVTVREADGSLLVRSLRSIGPLSVEPDLAAKERPPMERVLLGRSRALRMRLALGEVSLPTVRIGQPQLVPEALSLALHAAAIIVLADGMEATNDDGTGDGDSEIAATLLDDTWARYGSRAREPVIDATAAAFARVTLLGTQRAVLYLRQAFAAVESNERHHAEALAARMVAVPAANPWRTRALDLVCDALR
jgi:hypothetical protein